MNANGASRFRLEARFFEWRLHPPGRAPRASRPIVAAAASLERSRDAAPAQGASVAERQRCVRSARRSPASRRVNSTPRGRFDRWVPTRLGGALTHISHRRGFASRAHSLGHPFERGERCLLSLLSPSDPPSNEARLPAELKHITKRRRRN